jgi:hypothetical protein
MNQELPGSLYFPTLFPIIRLSNSPYWLTDA